MTLHDPARHLPWTPHPWHPARAQAWLRRWSAAALETWALHKSWPLHPRDIEGPDEPRPCHGLYLGSAGVWLALARVAAADLCSLPRSLADLFTDILHAYAQTPDTGECVPSWFLGEAGLLTARYLASPDPTIADRLAAVIAANRDNPAHELLWGAPGTMVAALFLHEATHDPRWADLFRASADALWSCWKFDEQHGAWLWDQDMGGQRTHYLGAAHGWAGTLYPLWRGHHLLHPTQQSELHARTLQGLEALAVIDDNCINWPTMPTRHEPRLVQWCHGSPGILTSLRHAPLPESDALIIKAANGIAKAGLLIKGVGVCHGSDGNGMALLEVYRRTADPAWLDLARQFAMGALEQSEADNKKYGQWHHSLWTGDAGLACLLLDCLQGTSRGMPGLDSLW